MGIRKQEQRSAGGHIPLGLEGQGEAQSDQLPQWFGTSEGQMSPVSSMPQYRVMWGEFCSKFKQHVSQFDHLVSV